MRSNCKCYSHTYQIVAIEKKRNLDHNVISSKILQGRKCGVFLALAAASWCGQLSIQQKGKAH